MKKARMQHHKRIRTLALWGVALVVSVLAFGMFASAGPASLFVPLTASAGVGLFFAGFAESYGMTEETFTPDNLIAGSTQIVAESGTLLTGENRGRGALCGKVLLGAVTETHAGNTGNGVMTPDAVAPLLAHAQQGVYKAVCIVEDPGGGTFRVFDPKGNALGDVEVGAEFASQIKFAIAAGAVDFVKDDTFLITVAAGSKKWKLSAAAAVDGSQAPCGILTRATNATNADVVTGFYVKGEFNENALVYGAGHTAASVRDQLRALGIHLQPSVAA